MGLAGLMALSANVGLAHCGSCPGDKPDKDGCKDGACDMKTGACKMEATAKAASISTAGLQELIKANAKVTILDARTGKFDDGKRIPGAVALSPKAADEDIAKVLPDKNAEIVTYCAGVKCPASNMLADKLKKLGYTKVTEYPEGIAGWIEAGNAVEQKGK